MAAIPLGAKSFKLSVVRTTGLFGKPALFAWSIISFIPAEPSKQTEL